MYPLPRVAVGVSLGLGVGTRKEKAMSLGDMCKYQLFSRIPSEKMEQIQKLVTEASFDEGEVVFHEGETADKLYCVKQGSVQLSIMFREQRVEWEVRHEERIEKRVKEHEKSLAVETLGVGEPFGWSALVKPHVLTATARATRPTEVYVIAAKELTALLDDDPAIGYALSSSLNEIVAKRLNHHTQRLIEVWGELYEGDIA